MVAPSPAAPGTVAAFVDFVDLEPGWRLRVVTPLLRSGGFRLQTPQPQMIDGTLVSSASPDFLGYETSWYSITTHIAGGIRIRLAGAETSLDGVKTTAARPKVALFQLPSAARFVRLLYVRRVSENDHDMAVLAAKRRDQLAELTSRVREKAAECRTEPDRTCEWIPAGISVVAEKQSSTGEGWVPAP